MERYAFRCAKLNAWPNSQAALNDLVLRAFRRARRGAVAGLTDVARDLAARFAAVRFPVPDRPDLHARYVTTPLRKP
jgi:hypothetical protein